jgi:hypothetical protein
MSRLQIRLIRGSIALARCTEVYCKKAAGLRSLRRENKDAIIREDMEKQNVMGTRKLPRELTKLSISTKIGLWFTAI